MGGDLLAGDAAPDRLVLRLVGAHPLEDSPVLGISLATCHVGIALRPDGLVEL
jgi:hypothetical protein